MKMFTFAAQKSSRTFKRLIIKLENFKHVIVCELKELKVGITK